MHSKCRERDLDSLRIVGNFSKLIVYIQCKSGTIAWTTNEVVCQKPWKASSYSIGSVLRIISSRLRWYYKHSPVFCLYLSIETLRIHDKIYLICCFNGSFCFECAWRSGFSNCKYFKNQRNPIYSFYPRKKQKKIARSPTRLPEAHYSSPKLTANS